MDTLTEVLNAKVANKLKAAAVDSSNAIRKMIDENNAKQDFTLKLGGKSTTHFGMEASGKVIMVAPAGDYGLHVNAAEQLAGKFGVPTRYLKDLVGGDPWQKSLSTEIMNAHTRNAKQDRFLIRSVNDEVRAVLSDSYKMLDSEVIVGQFIESANRKGATFAGGFNSGLNMWLEVLNPQLIHIETARNGMVDLAFGARIKTSDFGRGALELRAFMLQAVCLNGMVTEQTLREVHLGGKLPDDMVYAKDTMRVETDRSRLMIRDVTEQLLSEEYVMRKIAQVKYAAGFEVDIRKQLELMQKTGKITKKEVEETECVFVNNKKEDGVDGENTLWKLCQGLTAIARDKDEERKRDLQTIAGELLPAMNQKTLAI